MPRTTISARTTTVTRLPHLEAATHHPPGPRGTARAQQAGGRASPSEYWAHQQPNMAGRGPLPVTQLNFVPRAAFPATTAASGPDIGRKPVTDAELGPEGGFGRDAAHRSGRATSARPQWHYLITTGYWKGVPQRDKASSTVYHGLTWAFFGEPDILAPRPH